MTSKMNIGRESEAGESRKISKGLERREDDANESN